MDLNQALKFEKHANIKAWMMKRDALKLFCQIQSWWLAWVTDTLDQKGYHNILQSHATHSDLHVVGEGLMIQNIPASYVRATIEETNETAGFITWTGQLTFQTLKPLHAGLGWSEQIEARQPASATHFYKVKKNFFDFHSRENVCSSVRLDKRWLLL